MHYVDLLLVVSSLLFGLYFISSAIEYAYVFEMLLGRKDNKLPISPVIASLQLFWTAAFAVLVLVFHGLSRFIGQSLTYILAAAVLAILLRSLAAMTAHYSKGALRLWLLQIFALCTLATPLLFAAFGAYFLTGDFFWRSGIGVVLMASVLIGLIALGLSLLEFKGSSRRQLPGQLVFVLWLMLLGCVLPLTIQHLSSTLSPAPLVGLVLAVGLCLGLMLLSFMKKMRIRIWPMASLLALLAPLFLALADRPFLISGGITLQQASSSYNHGLAAASLLVLLLAAVWLSSEFFALSFSPVLLSHAKGRKKTAGSR